MSYTVSWLVKNRVILVENRGIMTLKDLQAEDADIRILLEVASAPVHIITDNRNLDKTPNSISAMQQGLEGLRHPNIAWVVNIISHSMIIRHLAALLARIMNIRFAQVPDMDEAIACIRKHDATVDWGKLEYP